jgi:hypothetical protein
LGCEIGDEILIVESQPISKEKRWVVQSIIRRKENQPMLEDSFRRRSIGMIQHESRLKVADNTGARNFWLSM